MQKSTQKNNIKSPSHGSWVVLAAKIAPTTTATIYYYCARWPLVGSKMAPRWPQDGRSWPQDAPTWPQDYQNMAPRWLKIAPNWPKMAPKWSKTVLRWPKMASRWPKIASYSPKPPVTLFGAPIFLKWSTIVLPPSFLPPALQFREKCWPRHDPQCFSLSSLPAS